MRAFKEMEGDSISSRHGVSPVYPYFVRHGSVASGDFVGILWVQKARDVDSSHSQ
jgi:hypothetical protein